MKPPRLRWPSLVEISVALFVLWGLLNFFAALFVPLQLQLHGSGALGSGGVVLTQKGDEFLLGRPLSGLRQSDPKLDALLVSSMISMCAQMMAYAVLDLGVAWFGLRRRQWWAFWFLTLGVFITVPYYVVIVGNYTSQGAQSDFLPTFYAPAILAVLIGLLGLGKQGFAMRRPTVSAELGSRKS